MKPSAKLINAARMALEYNAQALDNLRGLHQVHIEIKLDKDGHPCRALVTPLTEVRMRTAPLDHFTFQDT